MNEFKRGSIWIIKSQNEVRDKNLPFGSRPVIIISNDVINDTHNSVSYVEVFSNWNKSNTKIQISLRTGTKISVETNRILSINKKFLHCYQGQLDDSQLIILTKKLAENFEIYTISNEMNKIGNRILEQQQIYH